MSDFNWQLTDFDEILEYVATMVGSDFIRVVQIANDILEHQSDYTGVQASMTAIKLSSYRTKIGIAGSYYKIKTPETKKASDRLTKDALLVMYNALEEMINTLKLSARHEMTVVG